MHKPTALRAVLELLRADLDTLLRLNAMTVEEATGPESKAENKYDTRSLESSYLAAGQGERVLAMRRLTAIVEAWLDRPAAPPERTLGLCGLVHLADPKAWYLLLPDGGGRRLRVDGEELVIVTPDSPVGRALFGCREGDVVTLGRDERDVIEVA
jgi:hypothetical protein